MPRGRRDSNEREIIEALTKAGCTVLQLEDPMQAGVPDLLVGCRQNMGGYEQRVNLLLEVKADAGTVSPEQRAWHRSWGGFAPIVVRSVAQALEVCGVKARPIAYSARNVAQAGRASRIRPYRAGKVV